MPTVVVAIDTKEDLREELLIDVTEIREDNDPRATIDEGRDPLRKVDKTEETRVAEETRVKEDTCVENNCGVEEATTEDLFGTVDDNPLVTKEDGDEEMMAVAGLEEISKIDDGIDDFRDAVEDTTEGRDEAAPEDRSEPLRVRTTDCDDAIVENPTDEAVEETRLTADDFEGVALTPDRLTDGLLVTTAWLEEAATSELLDNDLLDAVNMFDTTLDDWGPEGVLEERVLDKCAVSEPLWLEDAEVNRVFDGLDDATEACEELADVGDPLRDDPTDDATDPVDDT